MGGILKGLFGSLVGTPTSGAGRQQPLSIEQVLHDEAKPIHDVDLSDVSGTDPRQAQNKSDSTGWQPILTAPINETLRCAWLILWDTMR
jgi:hypothetical protein